VSSFNLPPNCSLIAVVFERHINYHYAVAFQPLNIRNVDPNNERRADMSTVGKKPAKRWISSYCRLLSFFSPRPTRTIVKLRETIVERDKNSFFDHRYYFLIATVKIR
jgi:hypothetical protein